MGLGAGGGLVVKGFVRPYVVEVGPELVEASLLSGPVASGRDGGFSLESSMHPLVAAVLLR
jgi:hypothetical protein|tara:strand:- start:496 stop:678 length:183 start_codon:yes stop_codon:yes gene_type:complete